MRTQKQQMPEKKQVGKSGMEKQENSPDQDMYDIFVSQGIKIVAQMADKLKGKMSIDLLGNTLYEVVNKVEAEGDKHGVRFPLSVLLHGSGEILSHLVSLADVKVTEEQVKAAVGIAVGKYLQNAITTGRMSKEQVMEMGKQAQAQAGAGPQEQPPAQPGGQRTGIINQGVQNVS